MIVSIERENLNELVQTALRAVSSRVTMPILTGLLITAEGGGLTVTGTDLEISIRTEAEVSVEESGSSVVSGRMLGDIVKTLPAGELCIRTGDRYMSVKAPAGEYRIREMAPEDFPQVAPWDGKAIIKVQSGVLVTAIQQSARASSNDEKRPVLTGSLMERDMEEGTMRIVSTDSYRLAVRKFEVTGDIAGWKDCIIPVRTLNEVSRLAGTREAEVEIGMQEKQAVFKMEETLISSRLIEGQFPNYKQLIPRGERTTLKVEKEAALSALKRAMIFGHNIRFGVYKDHMVLTTETPDAGDSREEIPIEMEGEEMEVGFNGSYMVDGLVGAETESVILKLDDPQKPALIAGDGDESYIYVIMPVRLK